MSPIADLTPAQKAVLDRMLWRVMPLVTACMVIGTIDRSNIGFAKLTMLPDLGMTEAVFALGSSLFYVGYIAFEIPSALGTHRYGARFWLARIMFTWGLATLALGFTNSTAMFYILRFLLGAAEAGLFPSLVLYITLWFPRSYQTKALGMLTIGSAIGNGAGALISGPLLDLHGAMGLAGWQWIFLVTGAMPMVGVIVILRYMRDTIWQAKFLTDAEKADIAKTLAPPAPHSHGFMDILKTIGNPKVLVQGVAYTTVLIALYGVIYWSPSVVRTFGVTGTQNGLLVALPWAVDAVLLILIPQWLRGRDPLKTMICLLALGSVAFGSAVFVENHFYRYAMLVVGIPCISVTLGLYWTYPARMFTGALAATALATINSISNFGGLIGQNLMPAIAQAGGSPSAALIVPCVCLALFGLCATVVLIRRGKAGVPA